MTNFSVTNTWRLRELCVENNWFTCGSIEQYEKLFDLNREGIGINVIATIILICSSEEHTRKEILQTAKG